MFKKSLTLVALVLTVVFVSAFTTQMVLTSELPSSYDPNLRIDAAMQTTKNPLLIEFYTDACSTCRRVTPLVHELMEREGYKDKLTLVMLDLTEPDNQQIAQLFGVKELPGMFVFDPRNMKKGQPGKPVSIQVEPRHFESRDTLQKALDDILSKSRPAG